MAEGGVGGFGGFGDFGDVGGDTSASGDIKNRNKFDNGGFNYKSAGSGLSAGKAILYSGLAVGVFITLKKFKVI